MTIGSACALTEPMKKLVVAMRPATAEATPELRMMGLLLASWVALGGDKVL